VRLQHLPASPNPIVSSVRCKAWVLLPHGAFVFAITTRTARELEFPGEIHITTEKDAVRLPSGQSPRLLAPPDICKHSEIERLLALIHI
jgi:hypothetical protein